MTSNGDERAIREVMATWHEATRAGDVDAVLALMAEDVVFLGAGRPPLRGKAAFAALARAGGSAAPRIDAASDVREVRVSGDWAFVWAHLTVVATPPDGGPAVTRAGDTLSVFRKEAGRWVLARDANMLAPVPAAPTTGG
ncbi:MAG TPA: SgcJ/EcaC family oxidoreductase [Gemmatimonadales bacterium]|nr:SgcJ/EcaC family oxidoreductase [Gemmatimonadales bacterium]